MPVDQSVLDQIALSREEYQLILQRLGREPTPVELGMFGALWSEHCGYKHSKPLLRLFPTTGERVLVEAGQENAGAISIGEGLAIVMKIESHNHPSAVEPYQGAATGVGGIVRDIFAMGARPIALLNSLRFGPLSETRNRYLFGGVVGGIADYGNCLGIPNVGGEVAFAPSYSQNPLVNAMCVGLIETARLVKSQASGAGNLLLLVGADTGRDGIHGASGLASRTFGSTTLTTGGSTTLTTGEEERELRPTVQVGNPFLEKLLIEACLEAAQSDAVVAIQDLGAAGLTSACVESAARADSGVEIDVARVPRRESGMTSYEVMLSESQERMLLVVRRGREAEVQAIFDKWDLLSTVIGRVTEDGMARVRDGEAVVAEVSVALLTDPPLYIVRGKPPSELETLQAFDPSTLPDLAEGQAGAVLLRLLASPNVTSKESVYRQYDHQVQTNTVVPPGADSALLRIKGTNKAIALATDGNGRLCYLDPFAGAAIAVSEAARNVSCVGAEPLALTDCLNFGNPERPEVYYQLEECIKGMAEACRALEVPVISGNVSLYNETNGQPVYPTPVVGMLGLLEDVSQHCTPSFKVEGDVVVLLGDNLEGGDGSDSWGLGGSEYLAGVHGIVAGRPHIDLELEVRVQRSCRGAIRRGLLNSSHDCSDGGLAVALAESCIAGGRGFQAQNWPSRGRRDGLLFGERQSRIVVSLPPQRLGDLEALAREEEIPWRLLGTVGGQVLALGQGEAVPLAEIAAAWQGALDQA